MTSPYVEGYSTYCGWFVKVNVAIAGEKFRKVIDRELDAAKAVIVIWTMHSVDSDWVLSEANHAYRQQKLIPLRTGDLNAWRIPKPYDAFHTDLVHDREAVLRAVRRFVARIPGDSAAIKEAEALPRADEERARQEARWSADRQRLAREADERRPALVIWDGASMLSLILAGLALGAVFIQIPFMSDYAYWILLIAYAIRAWRLRLRVRPN
jgi:hypothetical protein